MTHDLRKWMRLAEQTTATRVRVYHGSSKPELTFHAGVLYGVRDFGFAASYAIERGRDTGFVHTLDFHFRRLATDTVIIKLAEALNIDISRVSPVTLVDKNNSDFSADIFHALGSHGYDGITGIDFGFRSDFEELPIWAVFNAARQITPVAVRPVTRNDLKSYDAPESS